MSPIPVSVFNTLIQSQLQSLGLFEVIGEITELRVTPRQGVFITLKDPQENANLSVGGYAPKIKGLDLVAEGMTVVITGTPDLYVPYGKFSFQAVRIVPHGEGALKMAFDKLYAKLEAEGLFAPERKKAMPERFERIALITAADSAAQGDFVKMLRESGVSLCIDFYPVTVQGSNAVPEISAALQTVSLQLYDAVVLIRGGGSLEDLQAFNDEEIVRRVAMQPHFTIVGVGHERDESLADYVADWRASTPTQAAVLLYQTNLDWLSSWVQRVLSCDQAWLRRIGRDKKVLTSAAMQVEQCLRGRLQAERLAAERSKHTLLMSLEKTQSRLQQVKSLGAVLAAVNPQRQLGRGYSILRSPEGRILSSVHQVHLGDAVSAQLRDGQLHTQVITVEKDKA